MKIAINTQTTGKFEKKFLNNREHYVTSMVPIVGNSVMNGGFYPLDQVQNTFDQLHFLPAPNGHPKVGNQLISAFHPLAVNAFNIGGMIRNPKMDGDKVVNEFWLDTEIANQSDDGQELISRIENGDQVGVSTGLTVKQNMESGQHDGIDYDWVANDFNYDHVAILLNEKAAGEHVGTALQTNSENVMVVNCADMKVTDEKDPDDSLVNKIVNAVKGALAPEQSNAITGDDLNDQLRMAAKLIWVEEQYWVWIHTMFPEDGMVVFEVETKDGNELKLIRCTYSVDQNDQVSLGNDKVEVMLNPEKFVPVGGDANDNPNSPEEDEIMGNAEEKGKGVTDGDKLTVENAVSLLEKKGFKVHTKDEADKFQLFLDNSDKFESLINTEEAEMVTLRADLVANSDLSEDDVKGMSKDMLKRLNNSFSPGQDYSAAGGATRKAVNEEEASEGDLHDDYTILPVADGGA